MDPYQGYGDRIHLEYLQGDYEGRAYPDDLYTGGDIQIHGEDVEDEPATRHLDSWMPYPLLRLPSAKPQPNLQQVIIGTGQAISSPHLYYPSADDLNLHYCQIHSQECGDKTGGLQARNTCYTVKYPEKETKLMEFTTFHDADLSGFGLALLVAFMIFLVLHTGWEGDKSRSTDPTDKVRYSQRLQADE